MRCVGSTRYQRRDDNLRSHQVPPGKRTDAMYVRRAEHADADSEPLALVGAGQEIRPDHTADPGRIRQRSTALGVQREDSSDTAAARGRSCAGGGLFGRGRREIHLLQEGLEAGVGAEGVACATRQGRYSRNARPPRRRSPPPARQAAASDCHPPSARSARRESWQPAPSRV